MKLIKTLSPPQWMSAPQTRKLMDVLNVQNDVLPKTLFVGGCVRNWLLVEDVSDIDLASIYTPDQVMARCSDAGIKTIPTGVDHGTVTAILDGMSFEITTLRKDVETDGRHAVIAFTDDWVQDAQRRDFTMNTLLADADGNVFDPLGNGLSDLEARRVVFVGDASERIAEDYLRILRFFRFHGHYGNGAPELDALSACRDGADGIEKLSKERIAQEFFKILALHNCTEILKTMFDYNVMVSFFESFSEFYLLTSACLYQETYSRISIAARFYVLCDRNYKKAVDLSHAIQMSNRFLKEMKGIDKVVGVGDLSAPHTVKKCLYFYGRDITAQALFVYASCNQINSDALKSLVAIINEWDIPVFPVTGNDLIAEGFSTGAALGKELKRREEDWMRTEFAD